MASSLPAAEGSDHAATEASEARGSIFHFHPPLLQVKKPSKSPHTTPRNVIAPDATLAPSAEPSETLQQQFTPHQRPTAASNTRHEFSASAAKYVVADHGEGEGTATKQVKPVAVHGTRGGRSPNRFRTLSVSVPRYASQVTRRTTQIFTEARKTYKHLSLQQFMAYVLLLFGMLSESTTPAPRYNVPIGIALFMTSMASFDHRPVVAGLCFASLVDIAWLLRPQEESFNAYFDVKFTRIASFSLAVCLVVKLWLIFSTYSDMGPEPDDDSAAASTSSGSQPSVQLWHHHLKYCFPRKTLPRRSHLSFEVLMRVLALIWIHGLSGVALFFLGVIATMFYTDAVQFRSASVGLPLNLAMIFRSATILTCYFVATNHMDYYGCLKLSGCGLLAKCDEGSAGDVVLKYNAKWMRMLQRVKVLDGLMGVYLVFVMYAAFHSGTFFSSDAITIILGLTAAIILLMDFWAPLLIMVVARCGALLHTHHRRGTANVDPYFPNQLEWEEEKDSNASSSSSSSSASPGSSSLDEFSSNSSSEFSSSSSSSGSKARRRRRRRMMNKRNVRRSTRAPLIPAGRRPLSTPIIDAQALEGERQDALELLETARSSGKGVWIRHWDGASGRAYLVHSATGEAVWEVVSQSSETTTRQLKSSSRRQEAPVSGRRDKSAGREPSARADSPPTSDSEVVITPISLTPRTSARGAVATSARTELSNAPLLSPAEFIAMWDATPDAGNFICRVTRIPHWQDLELHLRRHAFAVVSDGFNPSNMRTVHFYAAMPAPPNKQQSVPTFFLGEFIFDSLSLKLYATFRCVEPNAIVPYVKRLQLKDVVGSYTPCEP